MDVGLTVPRSSGNVEGKEGGEGGGGGVQREIGRKGVGLGGGARR